MAVRFQRSWPTAVVLVALVATSCGAGSVDDIGSHAAEAPSTTAVDVLDNEHSSLADDAYGYADDSTERASTEARDVNPADWLAIEGASLGGEAEEPSERATAEFAPATEKPAPEPAAPASSLTDIDLSYDGPVQVATVTVPTIYAYETIPPQRDPTVADWAFADRTQFGNAQVFLVTANQGDWLKVSLPTRPNGTEGWVHADDVGLAINQYRAVVDLSNVSLTVLRGPDVIVQTRAVIGKSATPTPQGRFFVNELLRRPNPNGAYGPFILGLSARSEALDTFNGSEALIAVHGTNNPGLIGSKASNGCIRIPNDLITRLANEIPLGTPIEILA